MLIIKPIQDKSYQENVCKSCNFQYLPDCFAYSAKIDEKLIAGCQFDILGKTAVIKGFGHVIGAEEDIEALIILGRAVLNFTELSGAEECIFRDSSKPEKYATMLGFKKVNDEFKIVLKGLFDGKCNHCN